MITRRIFIVLFVFSLTSCGLGCLDTENVKYEEKGFNDLANFILQQDEIYEMDDFTRHHKSLNQISIRLVGEKENQDVLLLSEAEKKLGIEPKLVSALRVKLQETKLRSFLKTGDTILFTVDGMFDTSWGYMYCTRGSKMDTSWFMVNGSGVKFVENINANWKRTIIK